MASGMANSACAAAPETAIRRTESKSSSEKCKPDAEHQQDDADLGELMWRCSRSATIARGEGADGDAGDEIADERREAQAVRQTPKAKASTRPMTMVEMIGVECGIKFGLKRALAR